LDEINEEIEELRRQLAEKEMKAAEVKMELHKYDETIEEIRGTFSRQLTRLVKKETASEESRKEWEVEEATYVQSRIEHEAEVTAHSEALVEHDNLISKIHEEALVADRLAMIIKSEVISNSENGGAPDEEVSNAQAEVLKCEAASDEAKQVLMAASATIDSLKDEIADIEVRLPILDAEKKQAASKRDFKAAGKASKTIKELMLRKERCEEELSDEAVGKQESAQNELNSYQKILDEKKAILHEKERQGGHKRMVQLVKKMFKLEKLREEVCGVGEENINDESVKIVGGFVLDSEIAALVSEGEELGNKFGAWQEIMLEFAEADDANDNDDDDDDDDDDDIHIEDHMEEPMENNDSKDLDEAVEPSEDEELASEITSNKDDVDDDDERQNNVENEESNEENMVEAIKRCKTILTQIDGIDKEVEVAIEEEDYEVAADLDEKIQELKDELKTLCLTDEDIESIKAMDFESSNDSKESQSTEKSYDIVSASHENVEEDNNEISTSQEIDETICDANNENNDNFEEDDNENSTNQENAETVCDINYDNDEKKDTEDIHVEKEEKEED
jgi:hypothetical protein